MQLEMDQITALLNKEKDTSQMLRANLESLNDNMNSVNSGNMKTRGLVKELEAQIEEMQLEL